MSMYGLAISTPFAIPTLAAGIHHDPGGTGSATRLSGVASTQSPSLLEDETTNDRLIIEYNSRIYETIDVLFSPRSVVIFNVRSTVGGAA